MTTPVRPRVRIDFVSDIACPWCAIGLQALEQAIARVRAEIDVQLHFQPFELNPRMSPEGEGAIEHLMAKYGMNEEQARAGGERIRARGAELGFEFAPERGRVRNTFDAHRLLHWAGLEGDGRQLALKHALLRAYFGRNADVSDHAVLAGLAREARLDAARAAQVLASDTFAAEVREREAFYAAHGIRAVPSVVLDERHLVQGGQPVEVFEQALRQAAANTRAHEEGTA